MSTISAGTTSTTALVNTGDTTGNLVFQTNGTTTAMTIDTSQNVGIGVTPSAWGSGFKVIQIAGNSSFQGQTGVNGCNLVSNGYYDGTNWRYITTNPVNIFAQSNDGAHRWFNAPSGTAGTAVTLTQAMTLDASGNLGIGTSLPTFRMVAANSATDGGWIYSSGATSILGLGGYAGATDGGFSLRYDRSTGNITFNGGTRDTPTERMRIDSSGNLMVGLTSGTARIQALRPSTDDAPTFAVTGPATASNRVANILSNKSGDAGAAAVLVSKFENNSTTTQTFIQFAINNNTVANGQINANGASAVAFGTWSDARLKENIESLPPQLASICALRPVEFDYKAGGHQIGFIAQEMQEVYPDAVGENGDGMLTITGWSKTEARLVKAIQELKTQNDELRARVAALEGAK